MLLKPTNAGQGSGAAIIRIAAIAFACVLLGMMLEAPASDEPERAISSKVAVDLTNVNAEGLRGPPTGLRAVHYEFCIPAGENYATEVQSIDPTVQFLPSPGRVGCSHKQVLVVGNTHQPQYREVLQRLAALEYVTRIAESFFE